MLFYLLRFNSMRGVLFIKTTFIAKFLLKRRRKKTEPVVVFKANPIQLVNGSKLFNLFEMRIEFAHWLVVRVSRCLLHQPEINSLIHPRLSLFHFVCFPFRSVRHFLGDSIPFHPTKLENAKWKSWIDKVRCKVNLESRMNSCRIIKRFYVKTLQTCQKCHRIATEWRQMLCEATTFCKLMSAPSTSGWTWTGARENGTESKWLNEAIP